MKKILLSVVLAGFAIAVQAGDDKPACSASGGCCAKKAATEETKAECPMAKQASATTCTKNKANKQVITKQKLQSPKAMTLADARR